MYTHKYMYIYNYIYIYIHIQHCKSNGCAIYDYTYIYTHIKLQACTTLHVSYGNPSMCGLLDAMQMGRKMCFMSCANLSI